MKILLIRRGALGDTVVTIPLLQILKEMYSRCHIEVIGDTNFWSLACPRYINKITPSDSNLINDLYLENDPDKQTVEYYNKFDLILGFLKDRDGTVSNHFKEMGISNYILKEPFTENSNQHIVAYTTGILNDAGIDYDEVMAPKIDIDGADVCFAENLINKLEPAQCYISIHPRTYGIKGLEISKFIELGKWVENELKGCPIWILGPVEELIKEDLESNFDKATIISESDLKKVAAVISGTDFYVGCDTGITHLAAAAGVNTISIFGPTNPDIWGSLGQNVKIIKTGNLERFNIEIVKRLIVNNINGGFGHREIIQI